MARLILLTLLITGCAGDARAPEVSGYAYVVRVAYLHDVQVAPYDTRKRCEVTRAFTEKELPEMPGYTKIVQCMPVGVR